MATDTRCYANRTADELAEPANDIANGDANGVKRYDFNGADSTEWAGGSAAQESPELLGLADMVFVQGGTFEVSTGFSVSRITLSDYYIGRYPVTQRLWKLVMVGTPIADPSEFKGDDLPVESVTWKDVVNEFLPRLNAMTGKAYRLPTEAEWEYAMRGGNKSCGYKYSGSNTIGDVAWYDGNSESTTHVVGTKSPNELGIYDMSGNVYEWVNDWVGDYSSVAQTNPKGPSSGSFRVIRGGGWNCVAGGCRASLRYYRSPDSSSNDSGFRLAVYP